MEFETRFTHVNDNSSVKKSRSEMIFAEERQFPNHLGIVYYYLFMCLSLSFSGITTLTVKPESSILWRAANNSHFWNGLINVVIFA